MDARPPGSQGRVFGGARRPSPGALGERSAHWRPVPTPSPLLNTHALLQRFYGSTERRLSSCSYHSLFRLVGSLCQYGLPITDCYRGKGNVSVTDREEKVGVNVYRKKP
jgi:hypothetical protein